MRKKLITLFIFSGLLSSCASANANSMDPSILVPLGAPTLSLYEEVLVNENLTTTSNPNQVKDSFVTNNYNYLVFDSIAGINFANQGKSNYKFLTLLTGGNFHLIGINKNNTDVPKESDYIVGFGNQNLIPNKVYNKLYNDAPIDNLLPSVNDLASYLMNINDRGEINNLKIDWIFIAQPALFNVQKKNQAFKTLVENGINLNIKDEFYKKFNTKYIPQAGLFVNNQYYNENKVEVENFLIKVNEIKRKAIFTPQEVKNSIDSSITDSSLQIKKFGFNSEVMYQLQKNDSNQFGIVNPDDNFNIGDIKNFLNILK